MKSRILYGLLTFVTSRHDSIQSLVKTFICQVKQHLHFTIYKLIITVFAGKTNIVWETSFIRPGPPQQAVCVRSASQSCLTLLQPHGLQPARLLQLWNFPSKNSGVDCHFLLQGIFLTRGLNWHLGSPALASWFFTTVSPRKPRLL